MVVGAGGGDRWRIVPTEAGEAAGTETRHCCGVALRDAVPVTVVAARYISLHVSI